MSSERILEFKEKVFWTPISFDADGVLFDNQTPTIRHINKLLGTNYKIDDLEDYWTSTDWIEEKAKCGRKTAELISRAIWSDPEILTSAYPIRGASRFMKRLYDLGIRTYVLTKRNSELKDLTIKCFKTWMPWIAEKQILIRDPNSDISADEFKSRTINEKGIRMHIEDSLEESLRILDNTRATVILMPHRYNVDRPDHSRLISFPYTGELPNLEKVCRFLIEENRC